MTAVQPPHPGEPSPPERGLTRDERGRDISEAQAEAEAETSHVKRYLHTMSPRYVWSMAEGYPVVVKQFLQFCLILIYPAWVFAIVVGAALHGLFYVTVYPVLWLLFWPVRAYQKKNHPEEYAANRAKYKKNPKA
jgi:YggT family protein